MGGKEAGAQMPRERLGRWPGLSGEGAQDRSANRAWLLNGASWHKLLL